MCYGKIASRGSTIVCGAKKGLKFNGLKKCFDKECCVCRSLSLPHDNTGSTDKDTQRLRHPSRNHCSPIFRVDTFTIVEKSTIFLFIGENYMGFSILPYFKKSTTPTVSRRTATRHRRLRRRSRTAISPPMIFCFIMIPKMNTMFLAKCTSNIKVTWCSPSNL